MGGYLMRPDGTDVRRIESDTWIEYPCSLSPTETEWSSWVIPGGRLRDLRGGPGDRGDDGSNRLAGLGRMAGWSSDGEWASRYS